jgi:hypothetical protein
VAVKVSKISLGFTCRLVKPSSTATPYSDKVELHDLSCNSNTGGCTTINVASCNSEKESLSQDLVGHNHVLILEDYYF